MNKWFRQGKEVELIDHEGNIVQNTGSKPLARYVYLLRSVVFVCY